MGVKCVNYKKGKVDSLTIGRLVVETVQTCRAGRGLSPPSNDTLQYLAY